MLYTHNESTEDAYNYPDDGVFDAYREVEREAHLIEVQRADALSEILISHLPRSTRTPRNCGPCLTPSLAFHPQSPAKLLPQGPAAVRAMESRSGSRANIDLLFTWKTRWRAWSYPTVEHSPLKQ